MLKPGDEFGRLKVLPTPPKKVNYFWYYQCQCSCGSPPKWYREENLRGHTTSCGCAKREAEIRGGQSHRTHGFSKHPLYGVWYSMKKRCYDQTSDSYEYCGGTGVTICQDWLYDVSNFIEWGLRTGWKPGLIIDRYPDGTGNYCPNNCRWATPEQSANNMSTNRRITAFGETRTGAGWARDPRCVVDYFTLMSRIYAGWNEERAITVPASFHH